MDQHPSLAIQGAIDSCPGLRRVGADVHVTDVLGSALVAGSLMRIPLERIYGLGHTG